MSLYFMFHIHLFPSSGENNMIFLLLTCNLTDLILFCFQQELAKKGSKTETDEASLKEYTEHQSLEKGILKETGLFLWLDSHSLLHSQIIYAVSPSTQPPCTSWIGLFLSVRKNVIFLVISQTCTKFVLNLILVLILNVSGHFLSLFSRPYCGEFPRSGQATRVVTFIRKDLRKLLSSLCAVSVIEVGSLFFLMIFF